MFARVRICSSDGPGPMLMSMWPRGSGRSLALRASSERIDSYGGNEFSAERAIFCMVYDRLVDPGSKLSLKLLD